MLYNIKNSIISFKIQDILRSGQKKQRLGLFLHNLEEKWYCDNVRRIEMIKKTARAITLWTSKYSPLGEVEERVICYGVETFLESIMAIGMFIFIGIGIGRGMETAISLLGFGILRTQAGGFHCEKKWNCRSCMLLLLGLSLCMGELTEFSVMMRSVLFLLMGGITWILAPVDGKKNKIRDEAVRRRKRKMAEIILIIGYVFTFFMTAKLSTAFTAALLFEIYTLLPKEDKKKWKKLEEEVQR